LYFENCLQTYIIMIYLCCGELTHEICPNIYIHPVGWVLIRVECPVHIEQLTEDRYGLCLCDGGLEREGRGAQLCIHRLTEAKNVSVFVYFL